MTDEEEAKDNLFRATRNISENVYDAGNAEIIEMAKVRALVGIGFALLCLASATLAISETK